MMTPPEHLAKAEELLSAAAAPGLPAAGAVALAKLAKVHIKLAKAIVRLG